jgi:hypothetical protein
MVVLWRKSTTAQREEVEMDPQVISLTYIHLLPICKWIWIPPVAVLKEQQRDQVGYRQGFGAINLDNEDNEGHLQEVNLHFFKCWRRCQQCSSKCRDRRGGTKKLPGKVTHQVGKEGGGGLG